MFEWQLYKTHQLVSVNSDLALVLSVSGVVLEHVDHVVEGNEGIVDCDNLEFD
jgi:hypothetical protein